MYLVFDTETTGLPRDWNAPLELLTNWPRLVQLAWISLDDALNPLTIASYVIRPDGFEIPEAATSLHGISHEDALRQGTALTRVLDEFSDEVARAQLLVAHNMRFDYAVLTTEYLRAGRGRVMDETPRLCTMLSSAYYCDIPGPYGPKWPTLEELHTKLFGHSFVDVHDAAADTAATARCFTELHRLGHLGLP